jgi:hypothetical protein
MGTVSGGKAARKWPLAGRPPAAFFEDVREIEKLLDVYALRRGLEGLPSPDPALRKALTAIVTWYARQPVVTDEMALTDQTFLPPDERLPLRDAELCDILSDLGAWATLTLKLDLEVRPIPRTRDTRAIRVLRILFNRLLSNDRRWWKKRHLPMTDTASREFTRANLERVAKRAPWWAEKIKRIPDRGGRRQNWADAELYCRIKQVIEERCGPGSATLSKDKRLVPTGLLYRVVVRLQAWLPHLAPKQTEYGLFKALERARTLARRL